MHDVNWREAWGRVTRFHDRVLRHVQEDRYPDLNPGDGPTDDLYAFFLFAWHFAEWLDADKSVDNSKLSTPPMEFRMQTPICSARSLTNGVKHAALSSGKPKSKVVSQSFEVSADDDGLYGTKLAWTITDGQTTVERPAYDGEGTQRVVVAEDGLDLVTRIYEEWERYLRAGGLMDGKVLSQPPV